MKEQIVSDMLCAVEFWHSFFVSVNDYTSHFNKILWSTFFIIYLWRHRSTHSLWQGVKFIWEHGLFVMSTGLRSNLHGLCHLGTVTVHVFYRLLQYCLRKTEWTLRFNYSRWWWDAHDSDSIVQTRLHNRSSLSDYFIYL